MVTYAITVVIATAWIIQMIHQRRVKIAKTPLDIPIALFVTSQLVSTLFSIDRHISWLGYYSRFNGGMWSIISYILMYYAFVTHFDIFPDQSTQETKNGKYEIVTTLKVAIATAVVVSLWGAAERLGVDKKLWVQDVQNRVFSTLGQPNWLAAYLSALTPVAMVLAVWAKSLSTKSKKLFNIEWSLDIKFWIFIATTILFFLILLFTRSRSGLIAFAAADAILWALLFIKTKLRDSVLPTFAILHVLFAIIVFFNGSNITQIDTYFTFGGIRNAIVRKQSAQQAPAPAAYTGPVLEVGGTESGTIRKYVWQAAITAWRSSAKTFFIGTGTETFAYDFYRFRPVGHNLTSEWDFLYNKAHNEYLNYLATTGLFGLGSYLFILGYFIVWFAKKTYNLTVHDVYTLIGFALFAGWVSILITNFFGFSVVITQIFLFLLPVMIVILNHDKDTMYYDKKIRFNIYPAISTVVTISAGTILLGLLVGRWYADTLYASSYRLSRSGQYAEAQLLIDKAVGLNPAEPIYHDEMSSTLTALAVSAFEQQQATIGGQLSNRALKENTTAVTISPQNVNFWKTRTKLYYSLSLYDQNLNTDAIDALTQALTLSPNDPKIYYNLAILYGRQAENDKAVEFLNRAVTLKTNYRDAYYALYVFHLEMKKQHEGQTILQRYLNTVDPTDKQFIDLLGNTK